MSDNIADHVYLFGNQDPSIRLANVILEEVETPIPWAPRQDVELPCVLMTISTDCAVYGRTGDSGNDTRSDLVEENLDPHSRFIDIKSMLRSVVSDRSIRIDLDTAESDMRRLGPVPIPKEHRAFVRLHNYRLQISCTLLVVSKRPETVIRSLDVLFQRLPITVHRWDPLKAANRQSHCYNKMRSFV